MPAANFTAGGTIEPSRFVIQSVSTDYTVTQSADATHQLQGISQEWSFAPQGLVEMFGGTSLTRAASSGQQLKVYGVGDICLLSMGATCTGGQTLMSDTNGRGTPYTASSSVQYPGAISLESCGTSGNLCRVQVLEPTVMGKTA